MFLGGRIRRFQEVGDIVLGFHEFLGNTLALSLQRDILRMRTNEMS